ncbi:lipid scramblase CLPTM1L [Lycorma delicatula]|uniref:lipid scramblase CLPTM1L n=1 Tax=Lycorma delicatula TaxID=130591 RepID=UPI003F5189D2
MERLSFTLILSCIFIGYILYSIWTVGKLFIPPECQENEACFYYYLHKNPKLQMVAFTSTRPVPNSLYDIQLVDIIKDFDYNVEFQRDWKLNIPSNTRQNGTLHIHIFVLPRMYTVENWSDASTAPDSVHTRTSITHYQLPNSGTYQLLTGTSPGQSLKPVSHMKTSITFNLLTGLSTLPQKSVPGEVVQLLKFSSRNEFLPIIYYNFLNDRLRNLEEIKHNSSVMDVTFYYSPIAIGKLRLMIHVESAFLSLRSCGFNDKDLDEVKGIFADTHIYLLCATIFISSIHLLFDFLALKNDVSFWRSRRSMEGLSGRTVIWRAFSQVVIFLYLMDEDTSLLVLGPSFVQTLIEFWKVQKIAPVDWKHMKLKHVNLSDGEKKTREFDAESMRYLSCILYPLCLGAAGYSLLYETHRSWYSWCIHSLVNGVYAFGFLFMLPQLFINYRLKSVAHLPWRAFMYKAFNTFIDDIFAFIITMPTAHRLACFRDDIIFVIYLYQRWLYPVDKNRVDDALSMDEHVDSAQDKKNM